MGRMAWRAPRSRQKGQYDEGKESPPSGYAQPQTLAAHAITRRLHHSLFVSVSSYALDLITTGRAPEDSTTTLSSTVGGTAAKEDLAECFAAMDEPRSSSTARKLGGLMNYVELVTIIFHTVCDSLGMLFNMALLYLVLFRTPSRIAVYSILIGNAALTDFVACLAACLIQQRIVPIKTSLVYFSHGPCQAIGAEFCYLIYYILKKQQPSPRLLKCLIAIVSLPSCFQLIIMCFANEPTATLIPILEQELPHYVIENETISGHTNVFEWKTFTAILHMTVPIVPVYVCILILRRRIIAMLSTRYMSENTKILHKQLLKVYNS
nr:7TM GPCR domain containing protein [Haemonchus contortus]